MAKMAPLILLKNYDPVLEIKKLILNYSARITSIEMMGDS